MKALRRGVLGVALMAGMLSSGGRAVAQPEYVGRYDVYAGWADLNSPELGLNQSGFNLQVGLNPRRWYSVGFDYTWGNGSELLTPALLSPALQAQIAAAQAQYVALGLLPPTYHLAVGTDATTQTFAAGPQLIYRKYSKVALFIRPALGALRERVVPNPTDPFNTVIVHNLAPAGFKRDWAGFYGLGGGGDLLLAKHVGLRIQFDAVHVHPFDDLLDHGRWTFRTSLGPSFHFGRNVPGK
jgi:hypothetical protein